MRSLRSTILLSLALLTFSYPPAVSATELDPAASTLFGWAEAGLPRLLGARLGATVVTGDFNCDDHEDLAIGVPFFGTGDPPGIGEVVVLPGPFSPALAGGAVQVLRRQTDREPFALFGSGLAAGDLDGDGCDELLVGEPGYARQRGAAHLYRGRAGGLGLPERIFDGLFPGDSLGADVAFFATAGGAPVAVLGAPGARFGANDAAGRLTLVLDPLGSPEIALSHCTAMPNAGENCGIRLAAGRLAGRSVLFAGAPGSNAVVGFEINASGQVVRTVMHAPVGQGYARFGEVFDAVQVDGAGNSEIVVGQPEASVSGRPFAGRLALLRIVTTGSVSRLETVWNRNQAELGFAVEVGDRFGSMVSRFDLDGDSREDLVVGAQGEAFGSGPKTGGVLVLRSTGGNEVESVQFLRPLHLGLFESDTVQLGGARRGVASLANPGAAGRDLVLGVPAAIRDASFGAEGTVVRVPQKPAGAIFEDGFESGDTAAWSSTAP